MKVFDCILVRALQPTGKYKKSPRSLESGTWFK
jgi:hypothetical protein